MASLPATTAQTSQATTQAAASSAGVSVSALMKNMGLLVALAAAIGIAVSLLLWLQEPDYRPVLSNVQTSDMNEAVDTLQANGIEYKLDTNSGALLVPSDQLYQARLQLASVGISDNATTGYELLDRDQGLGTSQFMEDVNYRRGLEGELARTIASLQSVKSARVHLALPKTSVFVRDNRRPSASVFVELLAGRSLREGQVAAIVNLVAGSVSEMDAADVAIIDQSGRLLSAENDSDQAEVSAYQFDYTRKIEDRLIDRIQTILEPVVGVGQYQAQVAADIDFTAQEETAEQYNPDNAAVRSEQTLDEQNGGSSTQGGVPGALSNQPLAQATAPEVAATGAATTTTTATNSGSSRTQATRNYELDRTISYTRYQQGRVSRLSVAVVVNNRAVATGEDAEGQNWSQAELDQLTELVRGAVGYDAARGDVVTVINAAFAPVEEVSFEQEELPLWQQQNFQKWVKQGLVGLIVLILIFAVIRPIMKSLSRSGSQEKELELAIRQAQLQQLQAANASPNYQAMASLGNPAQQMGGQTPLLPGPGQNYNNQLAAAQSVVSDNPQRAAQVIRQWVADNE